MDIVGGHHSLHKKLYNLLYQSINNSKSLSSKEKSTYIKTLQLVPTKEKRADKAYKLISKI
jgi:hypothetical protein